MWCSIQMIIVFSVEFTQIPIFFTFLSPSKNFFSTKKRSREKIRILVLKNEIKLKNTQMDEKILEKISNSSDPQKIRPSYFPIIIIGTEHRQHNNIF